MSIGERRFRVTFQRAIISTDDYGEGDRTWTDICTSWALIVPLKGSERLRADQVQSKIDHRIITRYRPQLADLDTGDRAIWKDKVYDIRHVIWRDHTIKEIELLATVHS